MQRLLFAIPIVLALVGCSAGGPVSYARTFPGAKERAEPIDVQAVWLEQELVITNTTARPIPAGSLWVNEWFNRPFDGLAVGETVRLRLTDFRDEFSEPFRAGGFFATRESDRVVSVVLEHDDTLTPLVVTRPRTR